MAIDLPILTTSVSRKLAVSISGLFLVVFLAVHLGANLSMLAGAETYNAVAHWMGSNPAILAMRPVLVLGFLAHIAISAYLALLNQRTRPERYAMVDPAGGSTWAARHPFILGVLVLLFLGLHVSSFSIPLTFGALGTVTMTEVSGVAVKDAYALVTGRFSQWWYASLYVAAMAFLGLHLYHGVQAAIQTLGLSDQRWRSRWTALGTVYAVLVAVGFATLPVFFFVKSQMSVAP